MKISKLYIDAFRGIREPVSLAADSRVNLFVGVNGSGKSSVLDAISLVFSWYIARMMSSKGRGKDIPRDDISMHSANGCTISVEIDGRESWKLYRTTKYVKTDKTDLTAMQRMVQSLRIRLDADTAISLPIFVHYGVNRIIPNKYPRLPKGAKEYSQLDSYKNALSPGTLFPDFFNWFRLSEDIENENYRSDKSYRDPGLEAVRRAMHKVFPDYEGMRVTRRPLALLMEKDSETFKISQLSDGEKCYIMLVCDIARRLAIANPTIDPLLGQGIVLIDEIDLHLHPRWQLSVVSRLRETFPNCQFFITTHSPLVASDTDGKVFDIKDGHIIEKETYGRLSSNILSSVFDMDMSRSIYVQSLIDRAYDAISRGDETDYDEHMSKIESILGPDDLDLADLRLEKIRRERATSK